LLLITCVAPRLRAVSSLASTTSTAMMVVHPLAFAGHQGA
jgi:hypothetical protein